MNWERLYHKNFKKGDIVMVKSKLGVPLRVIVKKYTEYKGKLVRGIMKITIDNIKSGDFCGDFYDFDDKNGNYFRLDDILRLATLED